MAVVVLLVLAALSVPNIACTNATCILINAFLPSTTPTLCFRDVGNAAGIATMNYVMQSGWNALGESAGPYFNHRFR